MWVFISIFQSYIRSRPVPILWEWRDHGWGGLDFSWTNPICIGQIKSVEYNLFRQINILQLFWYPQRVQSMFNSTQRGFFCLSVYAYQVGRTKLWQQATPTPSIQSQCWYRSTPSCQNISSFNGNPNKSPGGSAGRGGTRTRFTNVVWGLNTLRPRQDGRHFPDDIFKCIFLNENVWISIKISLKFVPKGPINIIPALVQIMAWRRPGAKPLSEPMVVLFTGAYMRHSASMS